MRAFVLFALCIFADAGFLRYVAWFFAAPNCFFVQHSLQFTRRRLKQKLGGFNPEFPLGNLMEKHQKVFFYPNLTYEDAPNGKSGFKGRQ